MTIDVQPDPGAAGAAMQLLAGFQVSQAMYVIAERGVATILQQEGPTTVAELAERTGTDPGALRRVIRALAPYGVFTTDGDLVAVTAVGATLSQEHPSSLYGLARVYMETQYLPFSEFVHSVRTGQPSTDKYFGKPYFDWIADDPARANLFSRAMSGINASARAGMFDGYRLPAGRIVADLGGADGSVLVDLLTRDDDAHRRGIVFDLPTTVPAAEAVLEKAGLTDRVETVGGDFFAAVPAADIYVLAAVLHDWSDEESRRILESVATAAQSGARLLAIEGVIPPGDEPYLLKTIDLTMLGAQTGKERTEEEFRVLLDSGGFTLDRVVSTPGPFAILEATLR